MPVERDPVTGRRLAGEPGGRADKGRTSARRPHPWRVPALVAGAVLLVVLVAVVVVSASGGDAGDSAASPSRGVTAAGPGGTADTSGSGADVAVGGTRRVEVLFTVTAVRAAPGLEDRVTVGSSFPSTFVLTGACDGDGPCTVRLCRAEDVCLDEVAFTPTGSGYTGQFESSAFGRPWPECGAVRTVVEVAVDGDRLSGTAVQQHPAPLGFDGGTSVCDFVVYDTSFASV
ncbi:MULTISPECIES: hypothetical protein [unclassified Blastococcus]